MYIHPIRYSLLYITIIHVNVGALAERSYHFVLSATLILILTLTQTLTLTLILLTLTLIL